MPVSILILMWEYNNLNIMPSCQYPRIIGIGGSSLATKAIYDFLKYKIKKKLDMQKKLGK